MGGKSFVWYPVPKCKVVRYSLKGTVVDQWSIQKGHKQLSVLHGLCARRRNHTWKHETWDLPWHGMKSCVRSLLRMHSHSHAACMYQLDSFLFNLQGPTHSPASFIHSFIHSFHFISFHFMSFIPFMHSFTHSFIHSLIHSFIHSIFHSVHLSIDSLH